MVAIITFKTLISIYISSIKLKYLKISAIWKYLYNILKTFYTFGVHSKRPIFSPFLYHKGGLLIK